VSAPMALKRRVFPRARNVIPWPGGSTIALAWASLATQLSPRLSPASCVSAGVLRQSHMDESGGVRDASREEDETMSLQTLSHTLPAERALKQRVV